MLSKFAAVLLVVGSVLCLQNPLAFGLDLPVWSVERFVDSKADWEKLVDFPMRLEGRVSSQSKTSLRLSKCPIPFTLAKEDLARGLAGAKSADIEGRLRKDRDTGKLYFQVESLKPLPSDAEVLREKQNQVLPNQPEAWIELGDWARERGKFYEDKSLLDAAIEAYTKGLQTSLRLMPASDDAGVLVLAKRAEELGLPKRTVMEFVHDACWRYWLKVRDAQNAESVAIQDVLNLIETRLPGFDVPLAEVPAALARAYQGAPLDTYRTAKEEQRLVMHRLLYIDVATRKVMLGRAESGENGDRIAASLKRLVPEQTKLIEDSLKEFDAYRISVAHTRTRDEILALIQEFEKRNELNVVEGLRKQWLNHRMAGWKGDGVPGLLRMAAEYRALGMPQFDVALILMDAYALDSTQVEIATRLNELGYTLKEGHWLPGSRDEPMPALDPGLIGNPDAIKVGMSSTELRRLMGAPSSRTAVFTAGGARELWTYGQATGTPLLIELERTSLQTKPTVKRAFTAPLPQAKSAVVPVEKDGTKKGKVKR